MLGSLENIKQLHAKNGQVPIEFIREFLVEPKTGESVEQKQLVPSYTSREPSATPKDVALQKGGKLLESVIQKQSFLESNNLFDPSKYFGGLDVPDLEELIPDDRLKDMFLEYLPTEMEEEEAGMHIILCMQLITVFLISF